LLQFFNEYTIFYEHGMNKNYDIVYLMLANLFEGNCILPTSHVFEDELFLSIGAEGDVLTEESKLSQNTHFRHIIIKFLLKDTS